MEADRKLADSKLNDSLKRFFKKFQELTPKHRSELEPIGRAVEAITTSGPKPETFVSDLLRFSAAVIEVRSSKGPSALKELPVPPYDLWLPFKAKGKMPQPNAVAAVSHDFTERINELSRFWRIVTDISSDNQIPSDPKLLSLRNAIVNQYHECNKRCSLVTADKSRLFESSDIAFSDLITQLIPTPAGSESEFDRFILGTYVVFCERLRGDVRQHEPSQSLPDPLRRVAAICREHFKDLKILRNRAANAHDNKEKAWELAPVYRSLIGRDTIDRDDTAQWLKLQKAVLEMLSKTLTEIKGAFDQPNDAVGVG
jgi:hypothetical protein